MPVLPWSGHSRPQRCEFLPVHLGEPGGGIPLTSNHPVFLLGPQVLGEERATPGGRRCMPSPIHHPTWPGHPFCVGAPWILVHLGHEQEARKGPLYGEGAGPRYSPVPVTPGLGKPLTSLLLLAHLHIQQLFIAHLLRARTLGYVNE